MAPGHDSLWWPRPGDGQSSFWLLFGVSCAVGLVFEGAAWMLSGLAAFAAYKAAVMLGFRGPQTLTRRVNELDTRPDFDGRFRVNDFFCHDDTWRMTPEQLVGESDVVLMYLRGFVPQNAGCVFEVHELVNSASLGRVVVTIDGTTDFPFLEKTLNDAWAGMRLDSPNRTGSGEVRVVRLDDSGGAGLLTLLRHLCAASDGTRDLSISNAAS